MTDAITISAETWAALCNLVRTLQAQSTPNVLYDGVGEFTRTLDGVKTVLLFDGHFKKMMAPNCRVHIVMTEDEDKR